MYGFSMRITENFFLLVSKQKCFLQRCYQSSNVVYSYIITRKYEKKMMVGIPHRGAHNTPTTTQSPLPNKIFEKNNSSVMAVAFIFFTSAGTVSLTGFFEHSESAEVTKKEEWPIFALIDNSPGTQEEKERTMKVPHLPLCSRIQ